MPNTKRPRAEKKVIYSHVRFIDLEDEIGIHAPEGRGPCHTSISILNPVVILEHLRPLNQQEGITKFQEDQQLTSQDVSGDGEKRREESIVRISTSFKLEVSILDFDHW